MSSTVTYDPTTAFAGVQDTTAEALNKGGPIAVALLIPVLAFGIVWRLVRKGAKG
jgi:hypothetical protein